MPATGAKRRLLATGAGFLVPAQGAGPRWPQLGDGMRPPARVVEADGTLKRTRGMGLLRAVGGRGKCPAAPAPRVATLGLASGHLSRDDLRVSAAYAVLGRRGQIGRLRRLGRSALARYGLRDARLTSLRHEHNTTFRVDAAGGPYVLRVNRPGAHTPATIASEMAWLRALREDTGLGVPEPVTARDGSLVVVASDPGVPEPRACVLLRRIEGRFVNERLTPRHLRSVARLQAGLQAHARRWTPPDGFARPPVDTLTSEGKVAGIAPRPAAGDRPTRADAERALELVAELTSAGRAAVVAAALDLVRTTTRALTALPDGALLIHGDLHQENYLFDGGAARAIDFDDAGWGFPLYDLAVTVSELEGRPRSDELRDALLDEHERLRPLPAGVETHLHALTVLRRVQLLMWGLESREHPAFRDTWRAWADEDLTWLDANRG